MPRKRRGQPTTSFFYLESAFGSVPHSLIEETFKRNVIPNNVISYFTKLYSSNQAVVQTPSWRSDPFHFGGGFFQGDSLSPTICLMVFNPVLQYLNKWRKVMATSFTQMIKPHII